MKFRGLYAIVDRGVTPEKNLAELAASYLKGGARFIQLRDKRRDDSNEDLDRFREDALKISLLKKGFDFFFIINDDVDTALLVQADGVHVGQDDAPINECRRRLGPGKLIGYSSHSREEAVRAEGEGADYVAFGAIFPTKTKGPGHPVQGLEKLREVVRSLKIPVVAIGGIGRDTIKEVLATGAASVAMISTLAEAQDPSQEASFFNHLFGS